MKIEEILKQIQIKLPSIVQEGHLKVELSKLQEEYHFSDSTKYRILKKARKLKAKWSRKPLSLVTYSNAFEDTEIVFGICFTGSKYFMSHLCALYWNEMSEQRPVTYHISNEIPSQKPTHSKIYNADLVKQAFMKSYRYSTHTMDHEGFKIVFIEKQNLKKIGVTEKKIIFNSKEITFQITNTERTLIDCLISPQYSGSILSVINAFENSQINLKSLYKVYSVYDPFYPYWQSIGLILEKTKGQGKANEWANFFNQDKKEFYLDKNYRSDWDFCEKWQVHYPKGLFRANR